MGTSFGRHARQQMTKQNVIASNLTWIPYASSFSVKMLNHERLPRHGRFTKAPLAVLVAELVAEFVVIFAIAVVISFGIIVIV